MSTPEKSQPDGSGPETAVSKDTGEVDINMLDLDKIISDSIHLQQQSFHKNSANEVEKPSDAENNHTDGIAGENYSEKRPSDQEDGPEAKRQRPDDLNLDLQFERAIEEHHRETTQTPEPQANHEHAEIDPQLPNDREQPDLAVGSGKKGHVLNEKEDLNMIAYQLEQATNSEKPEADEEKGSVVHGGVSIPANSELLNTNTAFAAYSALSSQMPPLAGLASAHLAALPLPVVAAEYLPPRIQLLVNTLPTLDNLSTQLLRIVAVGPYQKIIDLASNTDTPAGATYRDLTSLFEFTKRLYSEEDPFLTVEHIAPGMWKTGEKTPSMFKNREQSIESTLRKVNLATFLAATLGTIEVGFFYLNESFLDVFCPQNNLDPEFALTNMNSLVFSLQSNGNTVIGDKIGKILKPQAQLYLDLKTQAYISAVEAGERSREEILDDILPSNLEDVLMSRRGTAVLSPTELDFIDRCKSRKDALLNYPESRSLGEEYEWFTFLGDLFDYVSKNMGLLIWGKKSRKAGVSRPTANTGPTFTSATPHSQEALSNVAPEPRPEPLVPEDSERSKEIKDFTSAMLPSEIQEQQIQLRMNLGTSKSMARRPWSREEEKALRHALELKGPMWATILELFGPGGKISEVLKNRTQVQLKDKARNWKMFFLKASLPVPAYLTKVTGDLEREDKLRLKARSQKTAAAPVPNPKSFINKKKDAP